MAKFGRNLKRVYAVKQKLVDKKNKFRREKRDIPKKLNGKDLDVPFKSMTAVPARKEKQQQTHCKANNRIQKTNRKPFRNKALLDLLCDATNRDEKFLNECVNLKKDIVKNHAFKSFYKEFQKVIDSADVVIEVLDARDPLGSRCSHIEQAVINSGANKRLILLLNKIDLIPRDNLEKWLKYLQQEFPTVAFKASTQLQDHNLARSRVAAIHMNKTLQSSRHCFGANFLMKVLGNYCRNQNIMTSIRVGVVGYPNVGKSSVINSLKRSHACSVGAVPGITKGMQEVILDKHVRLLDSPGVVLDKTSTLATLALRNAVQVEKLDDVFGPAQTIIQRTEKKQLVDYYGLPDFSTVNEFLCSLAIKSGRYRKGGIPDQEVAARMLLNDWNRGVIKFCTEPPVVYQPSTYVSAEIVKEMGKAFNISQLEEQMELGKLDEASSKIEQLNECQAEIVPKDMDVDQACVSTQVTVSFDSKKKKAQSTIVENLIHPRFQQNKLRKKAFKNMKKKRKRNEKDALALSDTMINALSF